MSKVIEFLRDTLHRECIGEEEQLPGRMYFAVLDHVQFSDGIHLYPHVRSDPHSKRDHVQLTKRSRDFSAGGRYGGNGAFKRNADAKVVK